jgi:hypothetical protein
VIEHLFEYLEGAEFNCKVATFDKGEVILPCFDTKKRVAIFIKDGNKAIDLDLIAALCKVNITVYCINQTDHDKSVLFKLIETGYKDKTKEIESYYPDEFILKVKKIQNYYPKLKDQTKLLSDREQIELAKKIYPKGSKLLEKIIKFYSPDESGFSPADRARVEKDMGLRRWQLKIEGYNDEDLNDLSNEELINLHQQVISSRQLQPQDDIDGDYDERSTDNA